MLIGSQTVQQTGLLDNLFETSLTGESSLRAIVWAVGTLGIPVFLVSMARGLLGRDHHLQKRHRRSEILKQADLVILAGVEMDFRLNYGRSIPRSAKIISVATSDDVLFKNRTPDFPVRAHPAVFLVELARFLTKQPRELLSTVRERWSLWSSHIDDSEFQREREIAQQAKIQTSPNRVNPISLCMAIEKLADERAIFVADGGDFVGTASYILRPRRPLTWLDPGAFGTLGVGTGFAMAAAAVHPDFEIWLIWGDGAAGFSIMEFDTLVRHGLPIIAVIGNDSAWTQILRNQEEVFHDSTSCTLGENAHYHEVAKALGGEGFVIERAEDVEPILQKAKLAAKSGKPVLVNCLIERTLFRQGSISI